MSWKSLASLRVAVFVILGLAASLATATIIESLDDTPTAQYFVYRSLWFYCLLGLLGLNILAVMVDRWPWQRKHAPFLCAHIGILLLLLGSLVTEKYGLDGSMRITEGETTSAVDIDQPMLVMTEGENTRTLPMRWLPPTVDFKPMAIKQLGLPYDLKVDKYLSHAEPEYSFLPHGMPRSARSQPAIKLKLVGGPMRISQEFWLWTGDPGFTATQAGPAWLELRQAGETTLQQQSRGPKLTVFAEKDGSLSYRSESSSHEVVSGKVAADQIQGTVIQPGWRGGVTIQLTEWVPDAVLKTDYKPSRVEYGEMAPPSAIHVQAGPGGPNAELWLGLGSRAMLHADGHDVEVGYFRKRVVLPFAVRLERFNIEMYEGGQKPKSYASRVTVYKDGTPAPASGSAKDPGYSQLISMNEPLEEHGITLYQASYEDGVPRPVTSVLSVNRDPGRWIKYIGSLFIVLGSILLFAMKYMPLRPSARLGKA